MQNRILGVNDVKIGSTEIDSLVPRGRNGVVGSLHEITQEQEVIGGNCWLGASQNAASAPGRGRKHQLRKEVTTGRADVLGILARSERHQANLMRKSRACGARLGRIGRGRLARSGAGRRTCRAFPRSGQRPKGGFLNSASFRKIPLQPGREVDVWASFSDDRLEPSYAGLQTGHVAAAKSARRHVVDMDKFQLRAGQVFVPDAVAVDALRTGFSAVVAAWNGAIALR